MKAGTLLVLLLALASIAGCSRQESAWRQSSSQDTVAAYEAYVRDYPAGSHVAEARIRLAQLHEQQEWDRALRFDTPEAYQRYLSGYPSGQYATAARDKLSDFLLARAPAETEPVTPEAAEPAQTTGTLIAAATAAGDYRVQLGAFAAGEAAARRAWAQLLTRHGDLLDGLTPRVDVIQSKGRSLWRLQAGPLSEARAREVCAQLKARGAACLLVGG